MRRVCVAVRRRHASWQIVILEFEIGVFSFLGACPNAAAQNLDSRTELQTGYDRVARYPSVHAGSFGGILESRSTFGEH